MSLCLSGEWKGLELGLKLELCSLTDELWRYRIVSIWKPQNKCVEFEFFLGQMTMPKLRQTTNYFNADVLFWNLCIIFAEKWI